MIKKILFCLGFFTIVCASDSIYAQKYKKNAVALDFLDLGRSTFHVKYKTKIKRNIGLEFNTGYQFGLSNPKVVVENGVAAPKTFGSFGGIGIRYFILDKRLRDKISFGGDIYYLFGNVQAPYSIPTGWENVNGIWVDKFRMPAVSLNGSYYIPVNDNVSFEFGLRISYLFPLGDPLPYDKDVFYAPALGTFNKGFAFWLSSGIWYAF